VKLTFRILGVAVFSIDVEPPDLEEAEEYDGDTRLTTSDHSFSFAPDPVFPLYEWDDEDEDV
jgi:hypothetical protein